MAQDLIANIPDWIKSLWHMENELRRSAQNGLLLRKDAAAMHLAEARKHLNEAIGNFQDGATSGAATAGQQPERMSDSDQTPKPPIGV